MDEERRFCLKEGCQQYDLYPNTDCRKCGFFRTEAERRKRLPLRADENGRRGIHLQDQEEVYQTFKPKLTDPEREKLVLETALRVAVTRMQKEGVCRFHDPANCKKQKKTIEGCRECLERFYRARAEHMIGGQE